MAVAGPQGLQDENVQIRPAAPLTDGSTWVVDQTPQTNYPWYLLQPGQGGMLCLTLFVPAAVEVTLGRSDSAQTADSKTQASPGFPTKEVHFVRAGGLPTFHPVTCAEVRFEGETPSRTVVPCAGLFDER